MGANLVRWLFLPRHAHCLKSITAFLSIIGLLVYYYHHLSKRRVAIHWSFRDTWAISCFTEKKPLLTARSKALVMRLFCHFHRLYLKAVIWASFCKAIQNGTKCFNDLKKSCDLCPKVSVADRWMRKRPFLLWPIVKCPCFSELWRPLRSCFPLLVGFSAGYSKRNRGEGDRRGTRLL